MRRSLPVLGSALMLGVILTGCSSSSNSTSAHPAAPRQVVSVSACTKAMAAQLDYAESHPEDTSPSTMPAECAGIPDATLRKIASQVMSSEFSKLMSGNS